MIHLISVLLASTTLSVNEEYLYACLENIDTQVEYVETHEYIMDSVYRCIEESKDLED